MPQENQTSTLDTALSFDDLQKGFSFSPPDETTPKTSELTFEPLDLSGEKKDEEILDPLAGEKPEETDPEFKPLNLETPKDNFYTNLLKKKLEKGLWEDVIIKEGETETKLSEIEDLTEEEYLKLEEDQLAIKNEDIKEKYISIDGIAEEKKLILEIVKNGGNLAELFQNEQQLEKPFDESKGWDLENEKHQESIAYQHYLSQGNTPSRAKLLVEEDKKEFVLDSVAKQIVDFHQKAYSDNLNEINKKLIEDKAAEKENLKVYRSELTKKYKEDKVPEHDIKKLVDAATKEDQNGEFAVDTIYETKMKDPIEASELIFFLTNKEQYLQQKMLETKVKTNLSTMRTINRAPKDAAQKVAPKEEKQESGFRFNIPT